MGNKDGQICKKVEVTATYHHDSKNYHAFTIDESQPVKGSIYVLMGEEIPDLITVKLQTKAEADKAKEEAR